MGPRGRLLTLSKELDDASSLAERERRELSLLAAREAELCAALEACELLATEVTAAERRAKEVAGRLPGARQLLASKAVERARARERARRAGGNGGGGGGAFYHKK